MTATEVATATERESVPASVDEYRSHVSMHHTDAAGVVYVGTPYQWAQVGMENIFRRAGHPLESLHGNIHYPMVRQEINHFGRLRLGDPLTVRTWVDRVGNRSFTVATQLLKDDGSVAVTVEFTAACVARDGTKPPVEQWLRDLHEDARRHGYALPERKRAS